MTDHARAIEAGAKAIHTFRNSTRETQVKACIEAAIASGALVPASALVEEEERADEAVRRATDLSRKLARVRNEIASAGLAERERCASFLDAEADRNERWSGVAYLRELRASRAAKASALRDAAHAIRQLDIAPASGDYVAVRRNDLTRVVDIAGRNEAAPEIGRVRAMLHAASRTGGEK